MDNLAAFFGAASTAILGAVAFWFTRHTQRYQVQRTVGDLQSSMAHFRAQYPEIVRYHSGWTPEYFGVLQGRTVDPDADTIVRYYSYIDIGLEYCNTALSAWDQRLISKDAFTKHYRPLIRYFVAENYPFLQSTMDGPYLSPYIRDEIIAATREGWDWEMRHELLAESPTAADG